MEFLGFQRQMAQTPNPGLTADLSPPATASSDLALLSTHSLSSCTGLVPLRPMPARSPARRQKPTLLERIKNIFSKRKPKSSPTHKREGAREHSALNLADMEHSQQRSHRPFSPRLGFETRREREYQIESEFHTIQRRTESDFRMSQRRWLTENHPRGPPPTYRAQDPVIGEELPRYTVSAAHDRQDDPETIPLLDRATSPEVSSIQFSQS
ncbi:hypothetical protein XANCAGTX0491_005825 [Xanthoria calcicola]